MVKQNINMKKIREKEKEIERLTKFWYEYVTENHHKDHDCHWFIERRWSYGEKPTWVAYHYGYVFEGRTIECYSYEGAVDSLLLLIREAIQKEKEWAKQVLQEPKDYDESQIRQAKKIIEFEL